MQQLVYPTNFQRCILRCVAESFGKTCILLYTQDNYDSVTLEMAFTDAIYNNGGSVFECQLLDAKDGGRRFLVLTDIIQYKNKDWSQVTFMERYKELQNIVNDKNYYNSEQLSNECRLVVPLLFAITAPSDVRDIFEFVIPNYYGIVNGLHFCTDQTKTNTMITDEEKQDLVITKTRFSDVYHVTYDGLDPVHGNNIAYIPNIDISLKMRTMFINRNSIKMPCSFHTLRQKWIPIV